MMIHYRDKYGKKLDRDEWARMLSDFEYKRVGQDILWGGKRVSTVWLGLSHKYGGDFDGEYFETMVFKKGTCDDLDMERYDTLYQATVGHHKMVHKHKPIIQKLWERIRQWVKDTLQMK